VWGDAVWRGVAESTEEGLGIAARSFSRGPRCGRRLVVSACLLLIGAVIGGLPAYVWPQIVLPQHADAILIVGGEGNSRYLVGLDLALDGWAANLVVSNPRDARIAGARTIAPPLRPDSSCTALSPIRGPRRAKDGSFAIGGATRLAEGHRRHVPAAHFPRPVRS
jgi:hypothetical protein